MQSFTIRIQPVGLDHYRTYAWDVTFPSTSFSIFQTWNASPTHAYWSRVHWRKTLRKSTQGERFILRLISRGDFQTPECIFGKNSVSPVFLLPPQQAGVCPIFLLPPLQDGVFPVIVLPPQQAGIFSFFVLATRQAGVFPVFLSPPEEADVCPIFLVPQRQAGVFSFIVIPPRQAGVLIILLMMIRMLVIFFIVSVSFFHLIRKIN